MESSIAVARPHSPKPVATFPSRSSTNSCLPTMSPTPSRADVASWKAHFLEHEAAGKRRPNGALHRALFAPVERFALH
jgi:hypothetical protein